MTQKKVPINNCFECPHFTSQYYRGKQGICGIDDLGREITYGEADHFPKWCSLEDM